MKFKVGDKVRVKDGLKPDECGVTPFMLGYCGKVMTVKSTYSTLSSYYLVEDNCEFIWHEDTLEPVDSKTLRMADGTIIGDFNTGGVVSIHDLPTSEWYNPMRLTFKNDSSIEALPQKDDVVRSKNLFCNGFNGNFIIVNDENDALEHMANNVCIRADITDFDVQRFKKRLADISTRLKEEKNLKFTFYVKEGTRPDKKCNGLIPTMTTTVVDASGKKAAVTCDKADYSERQGVLEAIAQMACGGNFDKEYDKAVKKNKRTELHNRTCTYCGKVFDAVEEKQEHEAWHVECRKARHERYLLRKRAKEIAFEEQAQKMAKEMIEK